MKTSFFIGRIEIFIFICVTVSLYFVGCQSPTPNMDTQTVAASLDGEACPQPCIDGVNCSFCQDGNCEIVYNPATGVFKIVGLERLLGCDEEIGPAPCYGCGPQYLVFWNFGNGEFLRASYFVDPSMSEDEFECLVTTEYFYPNGAIPPATMFAFVTTAYTRVTRPTRRISSISIGGSDCSGSTSGSHGLEELFLNRIGGYQAVPAQADEPPCQLINQNDDLILAVRTTMPGKTYKIIFPEVNGTPVMSSISDVWLYDSGTFLPNSSYSLTAPDELELQFSSSSSSQKTIIVEFQTDETLPDNQDITFQVENVPQTQSIAKSYETGKEID